MEIDLYPKKKKVSYTSHPNFPSVHARSLSNHTIKADIGFEYNEA